jgi:hypothetical protein
MLDQAVAGPGLYSLRDLAGQGQTPSGDAATVEAVDLPWVDVAGGKRSRSHAVSSQDQNDLVLVLSTLGGKASPGTLWQASSYAGDIDAFYAQLRESIGRGHLRETRGGDSMSMIEITDEN